VPAQGDREPETTTGAQQAGGVEFRPVTRYGGSLPRRFAGSPMDLSQPDKYILPTFPVVLLLAATWYWTNFKMYTFPDKPAVAMKPSFGAGATKFGSHYYGGEVEAVTLAVEFQAPDHGKLRWGRVMAIGGQMVELKDGKVLVDGKVLKEPYLRSGGARPDYAATVVPRRTVFVLCDERGSSPSYDSRYYGPIPLECVTRVFSVPTERKVRRKK